VPNGGFLLRMHIIGFRTQDEEVDIAGGRTDTVNATLQHQKMKVEQ
jgi:hypothetical protein